MPPLPNGLAVRESEVVRRSNVRSGTVDLQPAGRASSYSNRRFDRRTRCLRKRKRYAIELSGILCKRGAIRRPARRTTADEALLSHGHFYGRLCRDRP